MRKPTLLAAALAVAAAGCVTQDQLDLRAEKLERIRQGRPTCTTDLQCERMWAAAQAWVVRNAGYKIQTATDAYIETYNSTDHRLAVRVLKEPLDVGYILTAEAWCVEKWYQGCEPDAFGAMAGFNIEVGPIK